MQRSCQKRENDDSDNNDNDENDDYVNNDNDENDDSNNNISIIADLAQGEWTAPTLSKECLHCSSFLSAVSTHI